MTCSRTLTRLGATVVAVTMPDVSQVGSAWLDLCYAGGACRPCDDVSEPGQPITDRGCAPRSSPVSESRPRSWPWPTRFDAEVSASIESMLNTVDCLVCPSMANSARVKEADPFDEETDEIVERAGPE